jgi:hypothetical protein
MELLERYVAGEHEAVWREICDAGEATAEAEAVATELMSRVAENVDTVTARLQESGYRFLNAPAHPAPDPDDAELLDEVEEAVGRLPLALRACLSTVGEVCLAGTQPGWARTAYLFDFGGDAVLADPLWLPPVGWLSEQVEMWSEDDPGEDFEFEFAPDELHKANISGSTHDIRLPTDDLDPVLVGVQHRRGIRLVEYLRVSLLRWGGFPGYEFEDDVPPLVGSLAEGLRPF